MKCMEQKKHGKFKFTSLAILVIKTKPLQNSDIDKLLQDHFPIKCRWKSHFTDQKGLIIWKHSWQDLQDRFILLFLSFRDFRGPPLFLVSKRDFVIGIQGYPQEIAGLIKGLWTIIVPTKSPKALFPAVLGSIGGVGPLDSHDFRLVCVFSFFTKLSPTKPWPQKTNGTRRKPSTVKRTWQRL